MGLLHKILLAVAGLALLLVVAFCCWLFLYAARCPAAPGNETLAPPAGSRPGPSRSLRLAGDLLRTVTGTRLVKALAFGACAPSYANRTPYGCEFLSTRVLLSCRLSRLSMGSNTRFASHRATSRPRYRRIGGHSPLLGYIALKLATS